MPVVEWGSCANCGRSCAGPHGSFCSDVCERVYAAKQAAAQTQGKKAKPATPTDQSTHQVPKAPPSKGWFDCSIVLVPPAIGIAYGLFRLVRAVR